MKNSTLFITVLLSLFIFQSTWNVAAAYCVHESVSEQPVHHFGHHSDIYGKTVKPPHKILKLFKYFDQISEDEHEDHLPSTTYMYSHPDLVEIEQEKVEFGLKVVYSDIHNFYQAPYLNSPKPPPTMTPL